MLNLVNIQSKIISKEERPIGGKLDVKSILKSDNFFALKLHDSRVRVT